MKKHKNKKVTSKYSWSAKPKAKRPAFIRNGLLILTCVALFFSSMYGFRCLSTKVCDAVIIDKFIRHDVTVLMPKGALLVEVADTRSSRELGLSGRTSMRDTEGLLFVFDTPGRYGFWMKDMKFPLDIIWINQNGVVVEIERELDASSYPKVFTNRSEASYVLEINGGRAEHFGLYLGSKVKIVD